MMKNFPVAAALLFCLNLARLVAQTPTATLIGTVSDPSNAMVSLAKVEVRNAGTNQVWNTETNPRGEFIVPNLAAGFYDVTISKDGFQVLKETGMELQLDQQARMQYHLQLGSVAEVLKVVGSAPLINTEDWSKGDLMVSREMVEMPLNGRSWGDLLFLMPGVLPAGPGGDGSAYVSNGQRVDNINFTIDGYNDRDPLYAGPQAQPNLDALQEFKMETSGYSADTGRASGGQVKMVLKSGTNQVHGALFEFLENDKMNARNFFATAKPELRQNQFGGLLSGPVYVPKIYNGRNRTFFLFSWESFRQVQGTPALAVVPTAAVRQGDFSAYAPIKDPLAPGTFFPNNMIPTSLISPVALKIQAYYPSPNYPGANNYYSAVAGPDYWNNPIIKIDQIVTPRDNLSFKYMNRHDDVVAPYNGGNIYPTDGQATNQHNILGGITYTRTFTPSLINEARFSISRTVFSANGLVNGTNYNSQFGLPGPTDPTLFGFPEVGITNYTTIGPAYQSPNNYTSTTFNPSDTLTWVKGAHLIKFGFEELYGELYKVYDYNSRGTYNFTGGWTNQPYADFLLGFLNHDSQLEGTAPSYLIPASYSAFVQDAWKVSSRLTLNLGLRYELPKPVYDKYGRMTNFDPQLGKYIVSSMAGAPGGAGFTNASSVETAQQAGLPGSLEYTNHKEFAPRIGFAWRPFGGNRTVLRGGYGIFYGAWLFNNYINNFAVQFPFVVNLTINDNASNPNYLTFANPFPVSGSLIQSVTTSNAFQIQAPDPYTQDWNITVEREIGTGNAIEASYTGNKGTHLSYESNINQPIRSAATYPNFPTPFPSWGAINDITFNTNSIYNAGSVTFRRRFANNFFYRASYTYAKSIDIGSLFVSETAQDPYNLSLERGRSDFDIGHVFNMAFSWEAPRNYNILLRGWQLAGTGVARTGMPFTVTDSNVNTTLGQATRPNRICKGTVPNPSVSEWYNVGCFPQVPLNAYVFGSSGRNILDGPGSLALNLALSRNFEIHERGKLQVRWEVFNFLNRANFNAPIATANTPNAATITSAGAARVMQVAIHYTF